MQRFPFLGFLFFAYAIFSLASVFTLANRHLVDPPLILEKPGFTDIDNTQDRKQAFFDFLAPMLQDQNQRILAKRQRLLDIQLAFRESNTFDKRDHYYINRLTAAYKLDEEDLTVEQRLERLIKRVDTIPLAMALAQAASESGWGASRFAENANNFFGQWCYVEGCGLVPNRRNAGAKHEVAKFNTVRGSINSYFRNLNTHYAYQEFRNKRLTIRETGRTPTSSDLIPTLINYSERRQDYLDELALIIRVNKLKRFENQE